MITTNFIDQGYSDTLDSLLKLFVVFLTPLEVLVTPLVVSDTPIVFFMIPLVVF